ncbi:MAG: hypothetical protein Q8P59_01945 [Dehalococcoidia bacterium]|nr:hypothetical protein [Dehalococcoidia bacterium]
MAKTLKTKVPGTPGRPPAPKPGIGPANFSDLGVGAKPGVAKADQGFGERLRKAELDRLEMEAAGRALGMLPKGENIQGQVAAMNAMGIMQKELKDTIEKKEALLDKARQAEDDAKDLLLVTRFEELAKMKGEVATMLKDLQAKSSPMAAMAAFREMKALMEEVAPRQPDRVIDNQAAIGLEAMRQHHELVVKLLDIQLMQFKEASERSWQEYKDKEVFRGAVLEGLQDLAAGVAAGLAAGRSKDKSWLKKALGALARRKGPDNA